MVSFLVVAGVVGVVGWLVLRARGKFRRAAEEARAREAEFLQHLAVLGNPPAEEPPSVKPAVASVDGAQPVASRVTTAGRVGYLSMEHGRAYRLLRVALPDHDVFPRASLRRILGPLAPGKDLRVDFVICAGEFRPVAVVDLIGAEDLPPVVALKSERLAAAGVGYARWDGQSLPSPEEVATSLLGNDSQS